MFFGIREDEAREVEAEGRARLEAGNWAGALEIAARLIEMRWSGGFELRALAQRGAGRAELALSGLEEGVTLAPDAGALWLLLGNLRSDAGRLEPAELAFEQALRCDREEGCEGISEATLRFNRAVTRERRGEPEGALADLDFVLRLSTRPAFAEDALWLAMGCLVQLERGDEALALSTGVLDKCADGDPRRPRLLAMRALVLDLSNQPLPEIELAFGEAVDAGYADRLLLELGRRLSPTARPSEEGGAAEETKNRYRLVVQARSKNTAGADGFFRIFDVVAANAGDAFDASRVYLPRASRESASVHSSDVVEEGTELDTGCHGASELMFFADP